MFTTLAQRFLLVLIVIDMCSAGPKLELGMTPTEVIEILGEPDRRAVLEGKRIRDVSVLDVRQESAKRFVFIYEASGIQVWFRHGRVTGVVRNGVSILPPP
jgi:hypothetical protein